MGSTVTEQRVTHILVVDDDRSIRETLRVVLQDEGYIVSEAEDGQVALRILQALDIAKPGTASQLLMYAEEASAEGEGKTPDRCAQLFLRRNLVFERLQLLSRVFAPQRVSMILKALEQQTE